jgi:A/G-specific adenine glycosylase
VAETSVSDRILDWYDKHGRHDLPWQQARTPYRVWIAEIMLQQTQVSTVIPYYERFMQSFPYLDTLAAASLDHVLEHWAGLGYYSRARNLHKAARIIAEEHGGDLPEDIDGLIALPGIGRSTAAAILAQALEQRYAILDGNVKRVLCRYHAVDGWPGKTAVQKQLWQYAEQHTPDNRVCDYTQAMMDMGATLCTRSSPACSRCPLQVDCKAFEQDKLKQYPNPRPKKALPVKTTRLLLLTHAETGQVLLEKRPPSGIWGGLWSLPEADVDESVNGVCEQRWGFKVLHNEDDTPFRHTFSHYHLDITPCRVHVQEGAAVVAETGAFSWCTTDEAQARALAAPIARIIREQRKA